MNSTTLPELERASGWIHESLWFIERQRLAAILRCQETAALLKLIHEPFRWTIKRHAEIHAEIMNAWTSDIRDLWRKLDRDEIWNLRLDAEFDELPSELTELHENFRTLAMQP